MLSFAKILLLAAGVFGLSAGCVGCGRVASAPDPVPEPVVRTARLVFVGDVMSHSPQVAAARTADGYDYTEVFYHVRPIFEKADLVVANLETTLRTAPPYTGYPTFAAPAELAFAMREAGIDVATVANNHICDKGAGGIRSTLAVLDSVGLAHTGAFLDPADRRARNPLYLDVNGLRFALLNYTYGTNGIPVPGGMAVNVIDTVMIAHDLAAIRRDSTDCVIVSYHWGEEYRSQPTSSQRKLAAWTRERGADIVIGGHPHVVEPFEAYYGAASSSASSSAEAFVEIGTPVAGTTSQDIVTPSSETDVDPALSSVVAASSGAYNDDVSVDRPSSLGQVVGATWYSLGNFVSNQRNRYTDGGMMAEITVTKIDSLPVRYDLGYSLVWVHTPWRDGVRRYEVLPSSVADTMLVSRPADTLRNIPARPTDAAYRQYLRFVSDTRRLLSTHDSVFTEK